MSKFNFTEITRNSVADILEVANNFTKVENIAATINDIPKVITVNIAANSWISTNNYYETTINNAEIKAEPYLISVYFTDLSLITSPINPKPNSQSAGSIILRTKIKPSQSLTAKIYIIEGRS